MTGLAQIRQRIAAAARSAGRDPGEITLVAVSKLQPAERIEAVLAGLSTTPKSVPSKWIYDERGSRLFEAVCEAPEYYPTRTEMALLGAHADEIAALAASGQASVPVAGRPGISVISTGDELVDPGQPIESYQVRRSNPYGIVAALSIAGFTDTRSAHLPDEPAVMRREIEAHLSQSEVIILSGGVSMGKHDHVPAILDAIGVKVHFHRVAERPGKPLWFGTGTDGQLVFALPGNPVAVLVCLYRYVLPALERMLGRPSGLAERVELAAAVEFAPSLTWFLPVTLRPSGDGTLLAQPNPPNTSGDVMSLAGTDGFVELTAEQTRFPAGYVAPLFRWRPRA